MTEKDKIFAEIHALLHEQIETLRGELLTPDNIRRYAERQERIKGLVERVGQNHSDVN